MEKTTTAAREEEIAAAAGNGPRIRARAPTASRTAWPMGCDGSGRILVYSETQDALPNGKARESRVKPARKRGKLIALEMGTRRAWPQAANAKDARTKKRSSILLERACKTMNAAREMTPAAMKRAFASRTLHAYSCWTKGLQEQVVRFGTYVRLVDEYELNKVTEQTRTGQL